jgi:CHAT domain-containing protein
VPDNSTAELMQIFYSNLLRHQMTPDEALLRAQFEFRSRFHKWSHPYYWAGFGVITQVLNESADQPMDLPRVAAQ